MLLASESIVRDHDVSRWRRLAHRGTGPTAARHQGAVRNGYGPACSWEVSSAMMSAAGCVRFASATPCPAHSERAPMSPVVPSSGSAEEYRTIGSPETE